MTVFTIGFTKTSAELFFETLKGAGVRRLLDVRLKNRSQLAGYTKSDDLAYFTQTICSIPYQHLLELAPDAEMLERYQVRRDWQQYQTQFLALLKKRAIEKTFSRALFDGACLLCSEKAAEHCHRRLVAEYLRDQWPDVEILHLPLRMQ